MNCVNSKNLCEAIREALEHILSSQQEMAATSAYASAPLPSELEMDDCVPEPMEVYDCVHGIGIEEYCSHCDGKESPTLDAEYMDRRREYGEDDTRPTETPNLRPNKREAL